MINYVCYNELNDWWDNLSSEWQAFLIFNYQIKCQPNSLLDNFKNSCEFIQSFDCVFGELELLEYYPLHYRKKIKNEELITFLQEVKNFVPIGINYSIIEGNKLFLFDTSISSSFYDLLFFKNLVSIELLNTDEFSGFDVNAFKYFPYLRTLKLSIENQKLLLSILNLKMPPLKEIVFYADPIHITNGAFYDFEKYLDEYSKIYNIKISIEGRVFKDCYFDFQRQATISV